MCCSWVRVYLILYNLAQATGWIYALNKLLENVITRKSIVGTYSVAGELILFLQMAAVLEIFHAAIGLIPGRPLPSLMQWGGRFHFIAAIVHQIPEVHDYPGVFVTFLAWCLSEVIRYPYYALSLSGLCPGCLIWLRYSVFVVLYPIGALAGEVPTMYAALAFIKAQKLYSSFFEPLYITYHTFVVVYLLSYPFLWGKLFSYMFKQRKLKFQTIRGMKQGSMQKERIE